MPECERAELDDLVILAALSCRTPVAVLAIFEAGRISTLLSYGLPERLASGAGGLIDAIAAGDGLVEVGDLSGYELGSELVSLRWACGVAIPAPEGGVGAVIAVVDARRRELTGSDQAGLMAVSRRLHRSLNGRADPPSAGHVIDLTRRSEPAGAAPMAMSQVLRCAEVAEIFAVSERTVMKWAADGRIPSFRTAGGRLRFRHEDIASLIDGHSRTTS